MLAGADASSGAHPPCRDDAYNHCGKAPASGVPRLVRSRQTSRGTSSALSSSPVQAAYAVTCHDLPGNLRCALRQKPQCNWCAEKSPRQQDVCSPTSETALATRHTTVPHPEAWRSALQRHLPRLYHAQRIQACRETLRRTRMVVKLAGPPFTEQHSVCQIHSAGAHREERRPNHQELGFVKPAVGQKSSASQVGSPRVMNLPTYAEPQNQSNAASLFPVNLLLLCSGGAGVCHHFSKNHR